MLVQRIALRRARGSNEPHDVAQGTFLRALYWERQTTQALRPWLAASVALHLEPETLLRMESDVGR
ncbi:MAG: hypothetical protein AAGG01_00555 [Planctomycetota bacterium]